MSEKLKILGPIIDLLEYKIRRGHISNKGGHHVMDIAMKNVDLVKQIYDILDEDLDEDETIRKVERLVE